jgi:hypothetical protein
LPRVDRVYSIKFQESIIHLTREQTLLLSTSAFKYNKKHRKPFIIQHSPNNISDQKVLDCFISLIGLFNDTEHIEINAGTKPAFLFLSHQLDNHYLVKYAEK